MSYILLIEPDRLLANTFEQALSREGYEVISVSTGQEAIYAIDERLPQLVVLELQLPAHNGLEFLYEFRSYPEWQEVPVIINTNISLNELAAAEDVLYNELGVRSWHYKPKTTIKLLLRYVNDQLQERQPR
jgi:DNA-binding response OmpR family regulator